MKNAAVRKALESEYRGLCTVYEYREVTDATNRTTHNEVMVLEDQPCKLSFRTLSTTNQTDDGARVEHVAEVFMAPEPEIPEGSKLVVRQDGRTYAYKNSGVPNVYSNHQELAVEAFKGWA